MIIDKPMKYITYLFAIGGGVCVVLLGLGVGLALLSNPKPVKDPVVAQLENIGKGEVEKPIEQPIEKPVFVNQVKNLKPDDKLFLMGKQITKSEYDVKKAEKIKLVQDALQGVAQDPNAIQTEMGEWMAMINLEGCGQGLEDVKIGSQAEQAALIQLLNIKLSNGC